MSDQVELVDKSGQSIGTAAKYDAHTGEGQLHRAFSIFIFDDNARVLLQQRAATKYHFAGRWTNTCCSHPTPDEPIVATASKRLLQEMGFTTDLTEAFTFIYTARDPDSELTEREFDHVFVGTFDGEPQPCPEEVQDWKWVDGHKLLEQIQKKPDDFSPWLAIALPRVLEFPRNSPGLSSAENAG